VNSVPSSVHGGVGAELMWVPLTGNEIVHKTCVGPVVLGMIPCFCRVLNPGLPWFCHLYRLSCESPLPTQGNFTVQSGYLLQYQALKYSFRRIICLCYT